MEHYFIAKEHKEEDFFEFKTTVEGYDFVLKSCDSIFSKDVVDYGTNLLIKTFVKNHEDDLENKTILDVGCGYGIIGLSLARIYKNASVDMCDINSVAVELSKFNTIKNHIKNVREIKESNAYESITNTYDFIITNPPIKAGKENLLNILLGAHNHLSENGELWLVIKKKHGEDSVKKALSNVFGEVEVMKRDAGYYILKAVK